MDTLQEILAALHRPILVLIEGAFAVAVPFVLAHMTAWLKARSHDARFHCAMEKVSSYTEKAVLDIAATYTKQVRSSGAWDGQAAAAAKDKALERARSLLGPAGVKEVQGCLGHTEAGMVGVLEAGVEDAYVRMKAQGLLPARVNASAVASADVDA